MADIKPTVYVDIYRTTRPRWFGRRQAWRWRAVSGGNGEILGGGEDYANFADCLHTVRLLFVDGNIIQRVNGELPFLLRGTAQE